MAAMYAVYHGSSGIKRIANKVHNLTRVLYENLVALGYTVVNETYFDTLTIRVPNAAQVHKIAAEAQVNLRAIDDKHVGVTLDESVLTQDLLDLIDIFAKAAGSESTLKRTDIAKPTVTGIPSGLRRTSEFLQNPVFNTHHSETEMLRYIHDLQSKDLSLTHSMIPLGSCTMKLNSTTSMVPLSWKEFSTIHPFVPPEQAKGYAQIIKVR